MKVNPFSSARRIPSVLQRWINFKFGATDSRSKWLRVRPKVIPVQWRLTQSNQASRAKVDLILIDTAGRLHTRFNLMEELKKIYRVVGKALNGAPHAVWLVLDATTGQNALQQARAFKDAVYATGVILTKLDSSARGGMAFAIQHELGLPILFAGLGEKMEDLELFDPDAFINGILDS